MEDTQAKNEVSDEFEEILCFRLLFRKLSCVRKFAPFFHQTAKNWTICGKSPANFGFERFYQLQFMDRMSTRHMAVDIRPK